MKYDPNKHHRRSIRLKRYDYHNAGAYFITICTINWACVLENLIANSIINDIWLALPLWFPTIELDEFMIMPNHVHFVVWLGGLDANVGIPLAGIPDFANKDTNAGIPLAGVLPENVGALNAQEDEGSPRPYAIPLPQKANTNIIRTNRELNAIRQYIIEKPNHWQTDRDNLNNINPLPPPSKMEDYLEELYELMGWKT